MRTRFLVFSGSCAKLECINRPGLNKRRRHSPKRPHAPGPAQPNLTHAPNAPPLPCSLTNKQSVPSPSATRPSLKYRNHQQQHSYACTPPGRHQCSEYNTVHQYDTSTISTALVPPQCHPAATAALAPLVQHAAPPAAPTPPAAHSPAAYLPQTHLHRTHQPPPSPPTPLG